MAMKRTQQPRRCQAPKRRLPSIVVGHHRRRRRRRLARRATMLTLVIIVIFSSLSYRSSTIDFKRTKNSSSYAALFVMAEEEIAASSKQDDILNCPDNDEAFVTTTFSGGNSGVDIGGGGKKLINGDHGNNNLSDLEADRKMAAPEMSLKDDDGDDDDYDLVDEVLSERIVKKDEDSWQPTQGQVHYDSNDMRENSISGHWNNGQEHEQQHQHQQQSMNDGAQSQQQQQQQQQRWSDGTQSQQQQRQHQQSNCNNNASTTTTTTTTSSEDNEYSVYHQLKKTTATFVHRHYTPLPQRGKCAIGSACGLLASRLSLGVANRIFRVAGATWVFSEAIHASGLCDDETESCAVIPEEARPWIKILRRSIGQKVENIRLLARKLWNKERIRELARQDEALAFGLAAGAFIGFII